VDPGTVSGFRSVISEPRLARYLAHCDGVESDALRLYAWNIEISAALWGPLSVLEVLLRNAIHDRMKLDRVDAWWTLTYLAPKEQGTVDRAIEKAREVTGYEPDADHVVGATSFGFWVGLTGAGHGGRGAATDYETKIWQPRLRHAFPHLGEGGRKQLHADLQRIKTLRNRIAHHEAIFESPHQDLTRLIIQLAGYVNADVANFISECERVDTVVARRDGAITSGVCGL
jgi:hypothetical protein